MDLKNIVLDMKKQFGEMEYLGAMPPKKARDRFGNTKNTMYVHRLFSPVNTTGDILVEIPVSAGGKDFNFEDKVTLINPTVRVRAFSRNGFASVEYVLEAEDIVKA